MDATEEFLAAVMPRQLEAGRAVHDGDGTGWSAMWSRAEPVTLFGARFSKTGAGAVAEFNSGLGAWFSGCTSYEIEIVAAAASGDLGYTVAYERTTTSVRGGPVEPYVLRVTHVYRRDDGEWRIVHRHADGVPSA